MSISTARQRLASFRTGATDSEGAVDNNYNPGEVYALGTKALASSLPDVERFTILEQTFTAALDIGNLPAAKNLFQSISKRFPPETSIRTQRLYGLVKEAEGDWDEAIRIYEDALKDDETNAPILKRLVAVLTQRNRRPEAIERLATYVDTYMQDADCWSHLATLYLAENLYEQAAFCYEELLLLKPQNHLYYVRYADVQVTLGKPEVAVKYYCAALELCRDHVRALYGLRAATAALISAGSSDQFKGKGSKAVSAVDTSGVERASTETLEALHRLAGDRLTALYEGGGKGGAELATVVKSWLQAN
ncbi:ER membrane complex subunit 2 [Rhizophlyctis rosea]|nr:ER membrane complex subunit 2 [Rhizophlyctis rosea]